MQQLKQASSRAALPHQQHAPSFPLCHRSQAARQRRAPAQPCRAISTPRTCRAHACSVGSQEVAGGDPTQEAAGGSPGRRAMLLAAAGGAALPVAAAAGWLVACPPPAAAAAAAAAEAAAAADGEQQLQQQPQAGDDGGSGLQLYVNKQQQYCVRVPSGWERKDKAGADVLFEDPGRRSTSVGVTVSPVRVASIAQFGDLAAVGQRLLEAEKKKESTLSAELVSASSRQGAGGATLYDYEYELDSTRGRKRIFNTVTITGSRLYILNATFKCNKEAGCGAGDAAGPLLLLRRVAATFDAGVA